MELERVIENDNVVDLKFCEIFQKQIKEDRKIISINAQIFWTSCNHISGVQSRSIVTFRAILATYQERSCLKRQKQNL